MQKSPRFSKDSMSRVLANNQLLFAAFLCLLLVAVLRGPTRRVYAKGVGVFKPKHHEHQAWLSAAQYSTIRQPWFEEQGRARRLQAPGFSGLPGSFGAPTLNFARRVG